MTDVDVQVHKIQKVAALLYQAMQHLNRQRHMSLTLTTNFRVRVRLHNLWQRVHGLSYRERRKNAGRKEEGQCIKIFP
jgi:hypothetical protein